MSKQRKERSDKGLPRPEYKQKLRAIRKQINDLKRQEQDIEKFERLLKKEDIVSVRKTRNDRKREARLQLMPEPRICPHCLKAKPNSKQWVLIKNVFIGCKSCLWYWKNNGVLPANNSETLENVGENCSEPY